ncbi:MAG: tRNA (adenosine(37)-N6)-threonylcarbamoyltransferase complex transferase subunit TsaD [Polyangiaceae bacterium]
MSLVLGIESSCDETGAAIVASDGTVLSDVVHSQVALHAVHGGVVPELASRDHVRNVSHVVREALSKAGRSFDELDAVAVTHRPGLVGALLVGVQVAKGIAWAADKPIVGVDHLMGHLLAVFLKRGDERAQVPAFPFVCLLASGGHTALYRVDGPSPSAIAELGATRDDAAGEAYDKVAKLLGLGYPGGPVLDKLARGGDPKRFGFTAPMASTRSLEFSFSGLKTRIAMHVEAHGVPKDAKELADLAASFQAAVTDVLARKLVAAAVDQGVASVVIGGGVAANSELRRRVAELATSRGLDAHVPSLASCTDNAAMIAYAGAMRFDAGERDDLAMTATSATVLPRITRKGRGDR